MELSDRDIKALTFDLFGTVLDLGGSLQPYIEKFLQAKGTKLSAEDFWARWRARQRIEQYQDSLFMLPHAGYLATSRRALVYVIAVSGIKAAVREVDELMSAWQQLNPFPDVSASLARLSERFRLVALSNGDPEFLEHLVKNRIRWNFDDIFSVSKVGRFKPHPAVYRSAAVELGLEPGECCMISSNSFDVVGARLGGYRAVYVNRYNTPVEEAPVGPDAVVGDFTELAELLV
ncbi:MAG: haloacid dehalogenase type II [Desulfatiglandaceae bacterium]